jgi:hypothetical protein
MRPAIGVGHWRGASLAGARRRCRAASQQASGASSRSLGPSRARPPRRTAALARADDAANAAYKNNAACKTPLDLIASQNPNLPMHPVFQEILNSPSLKGTFFVPTAKAWDSFFATVRQRQGNPEAPAMVARYGQVGLPLVAPRGRRLSAPRSCLFGGGGRAPRTGPHPCPKNPSPTPFPCTLAAR